MACRAKDERVKSNASERAGRKPVSVWFLHGARDRAYFTWRGGPRGSRHRRDAAWKTTVGRLHVGRRGLVGVPRGHTERRARAAHLALQTDPAHLVAEDPVRCTFGVTAPHAVWISDRSRLPIREGGLSLRQATTASRQHRRIGAGPVLGAFPIVEVCPAVFVMFTCRCFARTFALAQDRGRRLAKHLPEGVTAHLMVGRLAERAS